VSGVVACKIVQFTGFLSRDPKKPSDWGFIQHDAESGQFTAHNPKTGPLDFGGLVDGEYTFPKKR